MARKSAVVTVDPDIEVAQAILDYQYEVAASTVAEQDDKQIDNLVANIANSFDNEYALVNVRRALTIRLDGEYVQKGRYIMAVNIIRNLRVFGMQVGGFEIHTPYCFSCGTYCGEED